MFFELAASPITVDFWSDVRLPFEPRAAAKDARDQLRAALGGLVPTGELTAIYSSSSQTFCDIENVLIYNVGPGTFARLVDRRLQLIRRFAEPAPSGSGFRAGHHHRYTTGASSHPAWQERRVLGERRFSLPAGALRPESVWLAARRAVATDDQRHEAAPGTLGLTVELELPRTAPLRLASALKPLLDGLVCAFHAHDGSGDVANLAERVAKNLRGAAGADEVRQLLTEGPVELGVRPLLRPWREGVQWNPADDALVLIDVQVTRSDVTTAECRVSLAEVAPLAPQVGEVA